MLLLDEPDNYLDVPGKRWLEEALIASPKTVLFVSHDRELLDRVATRIVTLEPGGRRVDALGAPGPASRPTRRPAADRNARLEELRRRWDEEHAKLKALVVMYRQKAAYNSAWPPAAGGRDPAARFVEAGPPEALPFEQSVRMRLPAAAPASGRWSARASS